MSTKSDIGCLLIFRSIVSDAPFAESKEAIGGYSLLTVGTMDEAVAIGRQCPGLAHGWKVEVRPIAASCTSAAVAGQLLHEVRFATAPTNGFVAHHPDRINDQIRGGNEEPLALATERRVASTMALAVIETLTGLSRLHFVGLQRFHRIGHFRHAVGDRGDEPMAFVMAAEETVRLRLVGDLAGQQEQMLPLRLHVEDGEVH